MVNGFEKIKLETLKKLKKDKSSKGSIDYPIKSLVSKINQLPDYFTTSSCSGRISVVKEKKGMTKHRKAWIYKSHSKVNIKELKNIPLVKGKCSLKFETVILHIAARDLNKAFKMLKVVRESGWKKSGIISAKRNKVVLECSSTEMMAMPFCKNGKIILSEETLKEFCKEANEKLERAHQKIDKFLSNLKKNEDFLNEG